MWFWLILEYVVIALGWLILGPITPLIYQRRRSQQPRIVIWLTDLLWGARIYCMERRQALIGRGGGHSED